MKFQNYILINFVTHAQTDPCTDKPKAICPFNFSKVGGITTTSFSKIYFHCLPFQAMALILHTGSVETQRP